MNLHSPLSSDLCSATEIVEGIKLTTYLTCTQLIGSYLGVIWMQSRQHICILCGHSWAIRHHVSCRGIHEISCLNLLGHSFESAAGK